MDKEKTPAQRVRDIFEQSDGMWRRYHTAMTEFEAFLEGERYEDDNDAYNKDRRLMQIRGNELWDTIRHMAGEATSKPRSVTPRPIDRDADPDTAEVEAALVERELSDPWKGFEARYYEAIISARSKMLGVVWADWDPDCGPEGEILFRYVDGRRLRWDPAYDPHHPKCAWLIEERRCDVDWVHDTYPGSEWVQADKDALLPTGEMKQGIPLIRGSGGHSIKPDAEDNKATLWFCWYKNDKTTKRREKPESYVPLEPEQQYLSCASCGYRSPTAGELIEQGKIETELPEMMEGCPTCGGNMERIEARDEVEDVLAYSKGKRLVITAPFSAAPDDAAVYDGKWPIPSARSFPGLFLTCDVMPGKVMGGCDTKYLWDQQIASDNLRTLALQRVFEHRNYWVLPQVGIKDYRGQRFNFREDQFNVMYRDAATALGDLNIQMLNGTGLDPGWSVAFGAVQDALTQYRGVADFGLTEESSKNIAVGTAERIERQGNIPLEDFKRRCNGELGKFYGVVSDMIHYTYTPTKVARLNIDGTDLVVSMWGDDMPNYDFVIEETPDFTGLEKARSEAFNAMLQVATNPTTEPFLDIFAEMNNLPRSVIRKFQKRMEEIKEEAMQAEQQAMMQGEPTGMDQLAELEALNGAGMESAPMQ